MDYVYPKNLTHTQRIVPTGLTELTFFFGDKITAHANDRNFCSQVVLSGQQKGFYSIEAKGHLRMLTVSFRPTGLSSITKLPINELFNQTVDAKDIMGNAANVLAEQLNASTNCREQINHLETFLINRLHQQWTDDSLNRINHAVQLITPSNLCLSVKKLANQTCWSRKQFERVFNAKVGCSPKQFMNIIRFQYALHLKASSPNQSLLDIAYNCGYYDQSHMINDFLKQSGLSPTQYFSDCIPQSDYFDF